MKGTGFTCGVWPARRARSLVAVVVDEDGNAQLPLSFGRGHDEAWAMLAYLDASVGLDCELVLPDWLARSDALARFAVERGGVVWLVPPRILETVHIVAHLVTGPPARTAVALARLPLAPALRAHLRRLAQHQLPLFWNGALERNSRQRGRPTPLATPETGCAPEPCAPGLRPRSGSTVQRFLAGDASAPAR